VEKITNKKMVRAIMIIGLLGDRYVSIDPGGSGSILQSGDTILETEALVDIARLVSEYAFGQLNHKDRMGPIARHSDARKAEGMD
jgi:phospholipid/cholesterol/gamma-HCH transport system substrate-binding protein